MREDHINVSWVVKYEYDFQEDEIEEVRNYYNLMLIDFDDEEITFADAVQGYLAEERDVYLSRAAAQQIANFIKAHEET